MTVRREKAIIEASKVIFRYAFKSIYGEKTIVFGQTILDRKFYGSRQNLCSDMVKLPLRINLTRGTLLWLIKSDVLPL